MGRAFLVSAGEPGDNPAKTPVEDTMPGLFNIPDLPVAWFQSMKAVFASLSAAIAAFALILALVMVFKAICPLSTELAPILAAGKVPIVNKLASIPLLPMSVLLLT